jgi:hypothetical protein
MARLLETGDGEIGSRDIRELIPADWLRRDVGDPIYVAAVTRATPGVSEPSARRFGTADSGRLSDRSNTRFPR